MPWQGPDVDAMAKEGLGCKVLGIVMAIDGLGVISRKGDITWSTLRMSTCCVVISFMIFAVFIVSNSGGLLLSVSV